MRILLVGESWNKLIYHQKGFDHFVTSHYEEGATAFEQAMVAEGLEVSWLRAHDVPARFPTRLEDLQQFDVIVLSDIGSNSFALSPDTFDRSMVTVDRLELLAEYVREGGGLVMVGGYMSFTGIDAKARFGTTPLADVLPVVMLDADDRVERPAGVSPSVIAEHPVVAGLDPTWPALLGYNRFAAKGGSQVLAEVAGDPLLVLGFSGQGRVTAFASDLAPHWAPSEFVEWEGYAPLWAALLRWTGGQD